MEDINIDLLKEKLYQVSKALFKISETLVDESKQHISEKDALIKICSLMHDADIICSRYRVDRLIEDCMEPTASKVLDDKQTEWVRKYIGKWNLESPEITFPSCCDGCSNNPKNGGSGICNCTLPYMQNPITYESDVSVDDCCEAVNFNQNVFAVNEDFLDRISKITHDDINTAVERIRPYINRE